MLKPLALVIPALGALALAACQPEPTPEQKAVAAAREAMAAAGVDPNALGAAIGQFGAIAGAAGQEMTAEDRAALGAVMGSLQGAPANPAAAAYAAGMDKVFTVLATVKDDASFEAARLQLAPIYAEMAAPAAALKAMNETDRQAAFGSAWPQMAAAGMKTAALVAPLYSKPELAEKLSDLMAQMPTPE